MGLLDYDKLLKDVFDKNIKIGEREETLFGMGLIAIYLLIKCSN